MHREVYRYTFHESVDLDDIETSLLLSIMSIESLHGESQARLDVQHLLDCDQRACVIDASTPVGRDMNRLFTGYVRREFGDDHFTVKRVDSIPECSAATV